jgi:hypothetical protein
MEELILMKEQSKCLVVFKKRWIIMAISSLLVLVIAGGCNSTSSTATSGTQESSATGSTDKNEQKQAPNPAVQAAMDIKRLQNNQDNALTSEQKEKIKPILNELISTTEPSQDFLQQKADAISAVLTDEQKSSLTTTQATPPQNGNGPNGTPPQNGNGTDGGPPQNGNGTDGGPPQNGNNDNAQSPEDIYKQVLDSLT